MSNCTVTDDVVYGVGALRRADGPWELVLPVGLVLTSVVLLVVGARVVRGVVACASACVAFVGGYHVAAAQFDCTVRLAAAAVAAACALLLAMCLLRRGLVVLGALAFGVVGHFVYDALPDAVRIGPVVQQRPASYWGALAGGALVGAFVVRCGRKEAIVLASTLLGGGGLAFGSSLVVARAGDDDAPSLPGWVWLLVAAGSTGVGTAWQLHRLRRASDAPSDADGAEASSSARARRPVGRRRITALPSHRGTSRSGPSIA